MRTDNEPGRPRHPVSAWAWPSAVAASVITIAVVGGHVLRSCTPAGIGDAFKPEFRQSLQTTISTSVDKLRSASKLVVLQAEVSAEVNEESKKVVKIHGLEIDLGTTTVGVRCAGNKIQYYVPTDKISTADIRYDPARNQLLVRVPSPRLDEDMVEVQSDPARLEMQTKVGWARMDSFSGQAMRTLALKELRSAVIKEGKSPIHAGYAKMEAKRAILEILTPLTERLRPGVAVVVDFKE